MPVEICVTKQVIRLTNAGGDVLTCIPFREIGSLLAAHHCQCGPPDRLETCGANLVSGGFNPEHAVKFATAVIRWGGGLRLISRFKEENCPKAVGEKLAKAWTLLSGEQGQEPATVGKAVATVAQLQNIGQSFASKIVRFLAPDRAVIMDRVIRDTLGYRETQDGYAAFLSDCLAVLDALKPGYPCLRVADVDAAIFAKLQNF
ncbi:MAG: hypothetical protein ACK4TG_02830 [Thermaurantiacus sp.]